MEQLKKLRMRKKMTQKEVAALLGIDRTTYVKYETGGSEPNLDMVKKLADLHGVSVGFIMGTEKAFDFVTNTYESASLVPVLGEIRAGAPLLADGHIEGYELADVKNPNDYFYLRVVGDSMIDAGILPGSIVLIKKQDCADSGDIVACLVDGENATLKRFKQMGERITLIAANSRYDPIMLTTGDFDSGYAKILGVAISVTTKL